MPFFIFYLFTFRHFRKRGLFYVQGNNGNRCHYCKSIWSQLHGKNFQKSLFSKVKFLRPDGSENSGDYCNSRQGLPTVDISATIVESMRKMGRKTSFLWQNIPRDGSENSSDYGESRQALSTVDISATIAKFMRSEGKVIPRDGSANTNNYSECMRGR